MMNFQPYVDEIALQIKDFQLQEKRLFATSSFQTNSVVLLHILAVVAPEIPVYMMNTGFLFPETLQFRDQFIREFGLNVISLRSETPLLQQRCSEGRFLFASDPDACCHINKVVPLEPIISRHDVWINGIRSSQSATRGKMQVLQPTERILRYHPLLNWTSEMVYVYLDQYKLPKHPLEDAGFVSIGCRPCTRKWSDSLDDRGGRWAGLQKTECGLHTTLGS